MASHERDGLLPLQLFGDVDVSSEDLNNHLLQQQQQQQQGFMVSTKGLRTYESFPVSSGSSYSSWSDLSSPFGSELETTSISETTESEDEDFISELTRQMAESMLQDDEEVVEEEKQDRDIIISDTPADSVSSCFPDNNSEASGELSVNWSDGKSSSVCYYYNSPEFPTPPESAANADDSSTDEQARPVEVYELKNQPQLNNNQGVGVVGGCGVGKRVKAAATESTTHQQQQQEKEQLNRVGGGAGGGGGGGKSRKQRPQQVGQGKKQNNNNIPILPTPVFGSGMRAVFLGGSDKTGHTTSGTGVFLPIPTTGAAYTKPEPKKKSGCSTVLIPARVLQTLQQHFNTVGTTSPSNVPAAANLPWRNDVLTRINGLLSQKKEHAEFHPRPPQPPPAYSAPEANYHPDVVQLPQEWTY